MSTRSYVDLRCEDHHCGYSWRVFDHVSALLYEVGASTKYRCPQCQTTSMVIAAVLRAPRVEEWLDEQLTLRITLID